MFMFGDREKKAKNSCSIYGNIMIQLLIKSTFNITQQGLS